MSKRLVLASNNAKKKNPAPKITRLIMLSYFKCMNHNITKTAFTVAIKNATGAAKAPNCWLKW